MINLLITNFASEAAEGGSALSALGVDGKAFLIQFITWILVFVILIKFVFRPVINLLEKRRKTIGQGIELTSEMLEEKAKLDKEVEKTMAQARADAKDIVAKTHEQAKEIIKEAENQAKTNVDAMVKDAKSKINDESLKARRSLEKDIVNLVVEATEIVASQKIDAKKDAELINQALKGKLNG